MTASAPPFAISYDAEANAAYIFLKGSIAPGESTRILQAGSPPKNVILDFDAAGHLIGIELMSLDMLHPDLVPFAKRMRPAEGEI